MDTILVRRDVKNNPTVFFPETYDKERSVISYWDGVHGHQKEETDSQYYFTSRPASDEDIAEVAKRYTANFGTRELLIRKRLIKDSTLRAANPEKPNDDKAAQREFLDNLLKAFTKVIKESMPKD